MSAATLKELEFADGRRLEPAQALALVEFFASAKNWQLAPMFDGAFASLECAKRYVLDNPGHPLMVIIPRPSDQNCESFLVHYYNGAFYLDDDSMGGLSAKAHTLQDIIPQVISMSEIMFGKNECLAF